ncbi:MAG: hypothetical protein U1E67_08990 [Hyphomicrobiales bacterium]
MTVEQFTNQLLEKYGKDGEIAAATVYGFAKKDNDYVALSHHFPPPDGSIGDDTPPISILSKQFYDFTNTPCSPVFFPTPPQGNIKYMWCVEPVVIDNVPYELRRDLYAYEGSWKYKKYKEYFDCENDQDYNVIKQYPQVKAKCPPR